MLAVFGSGFGLYGYLPALVANGETVILPKRYEQKFQARTELAGFKPHVCWAETDEDALNDADGAVVALRPEDQFSMISVCAVRPNIKIVMLEKPLAPTPAAAIAALDTLERAATSFRIGYSFLYTAWSRALADIRSERGTISIAWDFLAHHNRHDLRSWKRSRAEGGGVVRFYGIQLIAVLAQLGYDGVEGSQTFGPSFDDITKWTASFSGKGRPECHVRIDSRSPRTAFEIALQVDNRTGSALYSSDDPFRQLEGPPDQDRRVPLLSQIHRSFSESDADWLVRYKAINRLWTAVESATRFAGSNGD